MQYTEKSIIIATFQLQLLYLLIACVHMSKRKDLLKYKV